MSDFSEAIAEGDKRTQYTAMRDHLAKEISGDIECCDCGKLRRSSGSETSALMLRLIKVLEELEKIPDTARRSQLDELRERRTGGSTDAARRQGTGRRRRGTGA
ncbi:hypothetical protein [Streptomyces sp. NPDC046925]|uniref:hypothetical protein n=1 Tax=Streptomyces sp. NPDC046925 TaxID=3155375 RepID=UPI0033E62563